MQYGVDWGNLVSVVGLTFPAWGISDTRSIETSGMPGDYRVFWGSLGFLENELFRGQKKGGENKEKRKEKGGGKKEGKTALLAFRFGGERRTYSGRICRKEARRLRICCGQTRDDRKVHFP